MMSQISLTNEKGEFCRERVAEVVLHERGHIGIEEAIVEKYKLLHWQKERVVDLICFYHLREILPDYKMQEKGDQCIDAFVDEQAVIYDLLS